MVFNDLSSGRQSWLQRFNQSRFERQHAKEILLLVQVKSQDASRRQSRQRVRNFCGR